MSLVACLARRPYLRSLLRRYLLIEQVSLREASGDRAHGISELVAEETPAPVYFSCASHEQLIAHSGLFLDGDPFRLAGFPDADPAAMFDGGLLAVTEPSRGMLYVPPRRFHCTLHNAHLDLDGGGLCTASGFMLKESVPRNRQGRRLQRSWLLGRARPRRAQRLAGRYTTIWAKWASRNYYHWLIESLPRLQRLAALDERPAPALLLPASLPAIWEDSLACCLPANMPVLRLSGWVQPEELLFSSYGWIQSAAWVTSAEREFVRDAVFARYGLEASAQGQRRIYVSRSGATMRRLMNEEEVQEVLAGFGFETVWLERLTFEEQVRLFHGASHVVGVHGAGFANLLFAGRSAVLELFARNKFKLLYFFLAQSLGQEHRFLLGGTANRVEDFAVDVRKLEQAIEELLAVQPGGIPA